RPASRRTQESLTYARARERMSCIAPGTCTRHRCVPQSAGVLTQDPARTRGRRQPTVVRQCDRAHGAPSRLVGALGTPPLQFGSGAVREHSLAGDRVLLEPLDAFTGQDDVGRAGTDYVAKPHWVA